MKSIKEILIIVKDIYEKEVNKEEIKNICFYVNRASLKRLISFRESQKISDYIYNDMDDTGNKCNFEGGKDLVDGIYMFGFRVVKERILWMEKHIELDPK